MKINHDIKVTIQIIKLCHTGFGCSQYSKNIKGLDGVSTAILSKLSCSFQQYIFLLNNRSKHIFFKQYIKKYEYGQYYLNKSSFSI